MNFFNTIKNNWINITWSAVSVLFFIIGMLVGMQIASEPEPEPTYEMIPMPVLETSTPEPASEPEVVSEPEVEPESTYTSMGEFRLTAYCPCADCCGEWGANRPLDKGGNPIIYTASQEVAQQGVTIAADTDVFPFGTQLYIDGHEYTVQDVGGAIQGNSIDIYFDSHEEALEFGLQYKEVFMKG